MRADWLTELDWKLVALGVAIGLLLPAFLTGILVRTGLGDAWILMLLFTMLSVMVGGLIASIRATSRLNRLINGLFTALICAAFSFVVGVAVDPAVGANLVGVLLLLVSYITMGCLGGLVSGLLPNAT